MGFSSALPVFIAPMALGKLAHPDGELCVVRAASQMGVPFCVSSLASVDHEDLSNCWKTLPNSGRTALFFQLYVLKDHEKARATIRRAKQLGYKALVVTLDTPVVGKREDDQREKLQADLEAGLAIASTASEKFDPMVPRAVVQGANSKRLSWSDLEWIKDEWGDQGPVVLKSIGCAEDAKMAYTLGLRHIYLSNHGGRQIASAPSSISTLLDINRYFPEVVRECDLYLDGGLRRGSDVLKALCLGATAVGIGRPFMYGLGAFGQDGVVKVLQSKHICL